MHEGTAACGHVIISVQSQFRLNAHFVSRPANQQVKKSPPDIWLLICKLDWMALRSHGRKCYCMKSAACLPQSLFFPCSLKQCCSVKSLNFSVISLAEALVENVINITASIPFITSDTNSHTHSLWVTVLLMYACTCCIFRPNAFKVKA